MTAPGDRSQREVLNDFAGLRYVELSARKKRIHHEHLFTLHRILADGVMDQGEAGRYRSIFVRVGDHIPPPPEDVSGLMMELLDWWNKESTEISPVISPPFCITGSSRSILLRTATGGRDVLWPCGNCIGEGLIHTISFRWTNSTGKIVRHITPLYRRFTGPATI